MPESHTLLRVFRDFFFWSGVALAVAFCYVTIIESSGSLSWLLGAGAVFSVIVAEYCHAGLGEGELAGTATSSTPRLEVKKIN